MVKINVDQCFPKPKKTSSNALFCPQPKANQFTVIEKERNQKCVAFKKLESENFDFFSLKKCTLGLMYFNRLILAALVEKQ